MARGARAAGVVSVTTTLRARGVALSVLDDMLAEIVEASDGFDDALALCTLARCYHRGGRIVFESADAEAVAEALVSLANAEDACAEHHRAGGREPDAEAARYHRAACDGFGTLYSAALRVVYGRAA